MDQQFIRPSAMDWTEDAELHRRYLDWEEEVKPLMEGPLSDGGKKPASIKVNYLLIWIEQQARPFTQTTLAGRVTKISWKNYRSGQSPNLTR